MNVLEIIFAIIGVLATIALILSIGIAMGYRRGQEATIGRLLDILNLGFNEVGVLKSLFEQEQEDEAWRFIEQWLVKHSNEYTVTKKL